MQGKKLDIPEMEIFIEKRQDAVRITGKNVEIFAPSILEMKQLLLAIVDEI